MKDLFDGKMEEEIQESAPLAERMRPDDFDGFFGQEELTGEGAPLREAVKSGNLRSLVFWGPPGSGKTTLARIIANKIDALFLRFSAVDAGVKDIRRAVEKAKNARKFKNQRTILFLDEIHRFNKAQQDRLLPHVEKGVITLIGATTENPSFEVIAPLLSRSSVYVLKPLDKKAIKEILIRALKDEERGLGGKGLKIKKGALKKIIDFSSGDARRALNSLEAVVSYAMERERSVIEEKDAVEVLKNFPLRYDKAGEEHYNLISAFIKSMRASDVDATLYWLARMIESGEDPRFIVRRMIIFASEDVGMADPVALEMAVNAARAVEQVGLPEAAINVAHGAIYLAICDKSRAGYNAYLEARKEAKKGSFSTPLHLRNAPTSLMKKMNYGREKRSGEDNFPEQIKNKKYYEDEKKSSRMD